MPRQEINQKIEQLVMERDTMPKRKTKPMLKRYHELQREIGYLLVEMAIVNGELYTYEKPITDYVAEGKDCDEAREKLWNTLKKLPGVNRSGMKIKYLYVEMPDGFVTTVKHYIVRCHTMLRETEPGTFEKYYIAKVHPSNW